MSNTPGISPITIDIEEVRHSESDGLFGDGDGDGDDNASSDEETEEIADKPRDVVEERRDRVFNP